MELGSRIRMLMGALLVVLVPASGDAGDKEIKDAIDRGVAFLREQQQEDGTWPGQPIGATALAGLTLLECGVPASDQAVKSAADAVRQAAIDLTHTYSLSLAIMFLDRLGDAADVPLIQSMAVRLLDGQKRTGGWTYRCPAPEEREVNRLTTALRQRSELVAKGELPGGAKPAPRKLPKEIQDHVARIQNRPLTGPNANRGPTDNSNTQFATMGLWIAHRHGIPVEKALSRVESRFRSGQNSDGGWGYVPPRSSGERGSVSTRNMTCAGLLGLAFGIGATHEAALRTSGKGNNARGPAVPQDAAVRASLLALAAYIGPSREPPDFYFFWSLERVGVAFGLSTIGNKDWYAWGSEIVVAEQRPNGSWRGKFPEGGVDTCFALLFLRRANLVQDLTVIIKGKFPDPATHQLKGGGLGAERLPGGAAKDAPVSPKESPPQEEPANKLIPPDSESGAAEIARLGQELVKNGDATGVVLNQLRDGKGARYTEALAKAIPQLKGDAKTLARDALVERLARMTGKTLADKLHDEDVEVRSAAALACATKEDTGQIPALITLLGDQEKRVIQAARTSLKAMTGQDFGPSPGAMSTERNAAIKQWRAWWKENGD